jgi:hypothetical protein
MAPRGASAADPPRARGSSVDGGIVQGADQAQPSSTMGTRQDILRDGKHHADLARPQTSESRPGHAMHVSDDRPRSNGRKQACSEERRSDKPQAPST